MVFDGEELLEFAVKSIRQNIDFIAVTYQTTSYFGNLANPSLEPLLERLKYIGLIDKLIYFEPDLTLHHKENELKLRNIGLQASKDAGCTHHISADVDEFYKSEELEVAKKIMENGDYNYSLAPSLTYYKDPTFQVYPNQNLMISFIHRIDNEYMRNKDFPFKIEETRRFKNADKPRIITELTIHHMSYVRKDIRKKLHNSDNGQFYKLQKFFDNFDTYKIGDRVCLIPDFMNRKTISVPNYFDIHF